MTDHKTGTREEWLAARNELLAKEKELTRMNDEVARQRRKLPWVPVHKQYTLHTADGPKTLAELFDDRSQLAVYRFMFGPRYQAGWPTCSAIADSFNGVLTHLQARDVTITCVSTAPPDKLLAYRERMGWSFPWASSCESDFNADLGFSASEEQTREWAAPMLGRLPPIAARNARDRHRRSQLSDREPRLQHIRPGRRGRLPHLFGWGPGGRVPDGLLRGPRPGAERP